MGAEKNIVAIELGSSSIRAIIGQKRADGTLQVLGFEKENAPDSIRKGVVYNIDKTIQAITAIKGRLEERRVAEDERQAARESHRQQAQSNARRSKSDGL